MNKPSDYYLKIVEWSEEDQCYVGMAPGLIIGGVHGESQKKVFYELCEAVEEAIQILQKEGRPLPAATANKDYSGKIALRIPSQLHKVLTAKAFQAGESVNKLIQHKLETAV
ncbi:toxin-antitoxin system HicB family antitoxin [bacterium]|nr:toxin-antitoxin system HicB family antitoxin [bacterium]